ncbi:MAG: response regulator transcription factor, partial [Lachnospiraceae bacterium]|nr:response regulator transcription factor [Lachnospiraceae bacterium]
LELAKQILDQYPEQKIVILSGYDLPIYRKESEKIGTKGFINKNTEPEILVSFLSQISQGAVIFNREIPFLEDLTESEKQILQLIADGMKRKEIAATLYISERTLTNHLQHIFEKLDVTSSVEAVTKSIQMGYIPPLC